MSDPESVQKPGGRGGCLLCWPKTSKAGIKHTITQNAESQPLIGCMRTVRPWENTSTGMETHGGAPQLHPPQSNSHMQQQCVTSKQMHTKIIRIAITYTGCCNPPPCSLSTPREMREDDLLRACRTMVKATVQSKNGLGTVAEEGGAVEVVCPGCHPCVGG